MLGADEGQKYPNQKGDSGSSPKDWLDLPQDAPVLKLPVTGPLLPHTSRQGLRVKLEHVLKLAVCLNPKP